MRVRGQVIPAANSAPAPCAPMPPHSALQGDAHREWGRETASACRSDTPMTHVNASTLQRTQRCIRALSRARAGRTHAHTLEARRQGLDVLRRKLAQFIPLSLERLRVCARAHAAPRHLLLRPEARRGRALSRLHAPSSPPLLPWPRLRARRPWQQRPRWLFFPPQRPARVAGPVCEARRG